MTGRDEPIGTKYAHYAEGKYGAFKCSNCIHYHHTTGTCDHPLLKQDAGSGGITLDKEGRPRVEATGCCNYYR